MWFYSQREGKISFEFHCKQSDSIKTEFLKRIHPSNICISSIQQKDLETCLFTLFKSQNLSFFSRGILDHWAGKVHTMVESKYKKKYKSSL